MASKLQKGPLGKILKLFGGTKHERDLKRLQPLVDQINEIYADLESLSDDELKTKTAEFRERLQGDETTDDLLPEAFAVVKERELWAARERSAIEDLRGKGIEVITGIDKAPFIEATAGVREGFRKKYPDLLKRVEGVEG